MEWEFIKAKIPNEIENSYLVNYKGFTLPHHFYADFVFFHNIKLEIKGTSNITNEHTAQCINYHKVSHNNLATQVNFGESKLYSKRIVF